MITKFLNAVVTKIKHVCITHCRKRREHVVAAYLLTQKVPRCKSCYSFWTTYFEVRILFFEQREKTYISNAKLYVAVARTKQDVLCSQELAVVVLMHANFSNACPPQEQVLCRPKGGSDGGKK
jgi:hypothetical protein